MTDAPMEIIDIKEINKGDTQSHIINNDLP